MSALTDTKDAYTKAGIEFTEESDDKGVTVLRVAPQLGIPAKLFFDKDGNLIGPVIAEDQNWH
jgi:hypothetical protein